MNREAMPRSPRADLRMLVGLIVVPPTAVLITLATYDAMWHGDLLPDGAPIHSLDSAASLGLGVGILAVLMTVVGVVPGVLWLTSQRQLSFRWLLLLGAALGNVPFVVIIIGVVVTQVARGEYFSDVARYWYGWSAAVIRLALGLISGVGTAVVFWAVAVLGTHDERNEEVATSEQRQSTVRADLPPQL